MYALPILSWDEVWEDIGRKYPSYAGTAYLAVGRRKDQYARRAIHYALKHKTDHWSKRHRQYRYAGGIVARDFHAVIEYEERINEQVEQLRRIFQGDATATRIIDLMLDGMSQAKIARHVGVSRQAINEQIKRMRKIARESINYVS